MAFSTQRAVSDGTMVLLGVSIGYIKQADIAVFYNDLPADDATWNWVGSTPVIAFTPAIPNGVEVLLKRTTQIDKVINRFTAGAGFTNQSMDTDFLQMLYLNQEAVEGAALTDIFNDVDFHGYRPTNIGEAVNPADALSLGTYTTLAAGLVAEVNAIKADTLAVYDSFDDRYLGAKAVAPTLDNDGNALAAGTLYWDTVLGIMRAWSGSAWVNLPAADAAGVTFTPAGSLVATNVQAALVEVQTQVSTVDATAKATPVDADLIPLVDSADSNVLKKLSWTNLKATLKTYFDTIYHGKSADALQIGSSATATQNMHLRTNNDGTFTLARGNTGAGTQDIMTIDSAGLVTLTQGKRVLLATAQATTSGITKDFAVPAWVQEIDVLIGGVSLSNTSLPLIQLGPVEGFETASYKSTALYVGGTVLAATNGFLAGVNGGDTGNTHQGIYSLKHMGGNQWVGSGNLCIADGNAGPVVAAGGKTLAGALTQLRLTSHDGAGEFDAGSVNLLFRG